MLPAACCAATLSAVHPLNGLGPEARIGPAAAAVATTISVAAQAAPNMMRLRMGSPPFGVAATIRLAASRNQGSRRGRSRADPDHKTGGGEAPPPVRAVVAQPG